ncbi:hypothetical protein [Pseudomonas sp. MM227]|uniref:hypothetical protein n=1 Tax=Pseudomonas sp. MM227 TaxID=3019968 RepID=UPI00221FACCB|nr:hypothetical protein [Pseudomonas sp. MM227]
MRRCYRAARCSRDDYCLPAFIAAEHGLQRVDPEGATLNIEVWMAFHEDVRATPRIQAVSEFVRHCMAVLPRL